MKKTKTKFILSALALPLALLLGACGALNIAPDGPYGRVAVEQGETVARNLIGIDRTITGTRSLIETFLQWELANRATLDTGVKRFADNLRDEAPKALQSATALRDAYRLNPTKQNRSQAEAALDVLDKLLLELAKYRQP